MPTINTFFTAFSTQAPFFILLISVLAFLTGVILAYVALRMAVAAGEGQQGASWTKVIWTGLVATMLLSYNGIVDTFAVSFGFNAAADAGVSLYGGASSGGVAALSSLGQSAEQGLADFIHVVGDIAFFRGLYLLREHGMGHQERLGKAVTHLIGGIVAIHVVDASQLFAATFFPGISIPGISS